MEHRHPRQPLYNFTEDPWRMATCWRGTCTVEISKIPKRKEALRLLRSREEMGSLADDGLCLYIGAWEYDADDWTAGGAAWSQGLSQDLKPGVASQQV
eukprot:s3601_g2.t1